MANRVAPTLNGPLHVTGQVEILRSDGVAIATTAETWLCRCGNSANKPFCDGSHKRVGFEANAQARSDYQPKALDPNASGAQLRITLKPNGPLRCLGDMQVVRPDGAAAWTGAQASLCRCGASKNKPFCDGSHREIGFAAE